MPVFYNINNTRFPVVGSFMAVAVNVGVIFAVIEFLQHRALALSISSAMTANFLFLFVVLYRKLSGFSLGYLLKGFWKVTVAALAMAGWLLIIDLMFEVRAASGYFITDLFKLAVCILSGALIYGVVLFLLKLPEIELIATRFKGRFDGGSV